MSAKTTQLSFDLATPEDDPQLRRLLRENAMPGRVVVTYEREPNYFLACSAAGRFWQVLVARRPDGAVAAAICRSTRQLFVNGEPEEVGSLGQLRVDSSARGSWMVSRGVAPLRELHADGRVEGYLLTITEENRIARGLLVERARRHLPRLRELGRLYTLAIVLRRGRGPADLAGVASARREDLPAVVAFWREHGSARQFFPAYSEEELAAGLLPGLGWDDLTIIWDKGRVIGVGALWDQSAYKQTIVRGYSGTLRSLRPLYNAWLRLSGARPLPEVGQPIRAVYASALCVARDDPRIFRRLLEALYERAARRGYAYLLFGLCDRDPLLTETRRYRHIAYHSRLYSLCWDDGGHFHARLDQRIPYVEIAAL